MEKRLASGRSGAVVGKRPPQRRQQGRADPPTRTGGRDGRVAQRRIGGDGRSGVRVNGQTDNHSVAGRNGWDVQRFALRAEHSARVRGRSGFALYCWQPQWTACWRAAMCNCQAVGASCTDGELNSMLSAEPVARNTRTSRPCPVAVVHSTGWTQRGSTRHGLSGYFSPGSRAAATLPGGEGGGRGGENRPTHAAAAAAGPLAAAGATARRQSPSSAGRRHVIGRPRTARPEVRRSPARRAPRGGSPFPPPPPPLPRGRASARLCRRPSRSCSPVGLGFAARSGISHNPHHASSRLAYRLVALPPAPRLAPPVGFFSLRR